MGQEYRTLEEPDDPVSEDILEYRDPAIMSRWLCRYVLETRQENGTSKDAVRLICRYNKVPFNFLDKTDVRGIGAEVKSAETISYEHENLFWSVGALGYNDPRTSVLFCVLGLSFCLRGGQEQRDLCWQTLSLRSKCL